MIKTTTVEQDASFAQVLLDNFSIDAYTAIEWVRDNFDPEDIFSVDVLDQWAYERGYIHSNECDEEAA